MTTWKEVKEAWKELPKIRKWNLAAFFIACICMAAMIMMGMMQFEKYANLIPDEYKYCIGGVFICWGGGFMFNYIYSRNLANRINEIEKELEKVKE